MALYCYGLAPDARFWMLRLLRHILFSYFGMLGASGRFRRSDAGMAAGSLMITIVEAALLAMPRISARRYNIARFYDVTLLLWLMASLMLARD